MVLSRRVGLEVASSASSATDESVLAIDRTGDGPMMTGLVSDEPDVLLTVIDVVSELSVAGPPTSRSIKRLYGP
jgi:hypothetical protein